MIQIIKDNVVLSVKEEDLVQYESMGFKRIGEVTKETNSKAVKTEKKKK